MLLHTLTSMPNKTHETTTPNLQETLPGFLRDYIDYAARLTDAPAEFHAFTALNALGAAASRVRVTFGRASSPLALWTVLVAPSSFYRKTTSIELGQRLLAAACPEAVTPMLYRYDALHYHLRRGQRLLAVDQFTELLTNEARERLIEYGDAHAPVSILAGASTAHVSSQVASLDISSGFLSRFVLVVAEQKTKLLGAPGAPEPETEARLSRFFEDAARLEGTASFERSWKEFTRWGEATARWISAQTRPSLQENAAGLANRMELTVLKLAALIEIAATGSLDVSPDSMQAAVALEQFARTSFLRLMNREIGRARRFNHDLRVLGMVRRNPGITRRRLQQNVHLDAETLRSVLAGLQGSGKIRSNGGVISAGGGTDDLYVVSANSANTDVAEL